MQYTLSLVVTPKKTHCAVIPRGHVNSYPLTFDKEPKPYHNQYMLLEVDGKPVIYGVTGPNPSAELIRAILTKWSDRTGKTLVYKAFLSHPDTYQITRPEIQMWLCEHANLEELRPSEMAQLLRPFAEERKINADA